MPETIIQTEGSEVILANLDERIVEGCLVPFNEVGQTNAGRLVVEAGALALPSDPAVIGLNLDHDRTQPIGRAARVWEDLERQPVGIWAAFAVAQTPEGDAYLADLASVDEHGQPNGARRRLSGEFLTAIRAGKAVAGSGRLWGAAAVPRGAFPSAMVLAADTSDEVASTRYVTEYTDSDGVVWRRVEESQTTVQETDSGTVTTTTTTVAEETSTDEEEEATVPENNTTTIQAGHVPATQLAGGSQVETPAQVLARLPEARDVFAAIATLRNPMSRDDVAATQVLAALQDVTTTNAGGLAAGGTVPANWLGAIAQGVPYVREYITLGNLGTDISLGGKRGFKVKRGTAGAPVEGNFDGSWAGDKSAVNSYKGFSTPHQSVLDKFAIAEDFAREFFDLPGGEEYVAAFVALIVEDHLVWSDETALEYWVETAGAPIAPNAAAYPDNYPPALGKLIQGILTVKRRKADGRRDVPSFAIANDAAYEELMYAAGGEQNLPAFVNMALSTNGTGTVDGNVQIVNGDVGIEDSSAVIVGAGYAIDFDETAGGPLQIDALDLAKGGVDKAVHGYLQTFVKRPEAVVLIGTADV